MSMSHGVIHGLIPAGGIGARAQDLSDAGSTPLPKQYRSIQGKAMLTHAVHALLADERIVDVVVGVQSDDSLAATHLAGVDQVRVLPSAGSTRAHTVLQTLQDSSFEAQDWVLVHDAARPKLPAARLRALIDCCVHHNQGGLLAMPAADTVKLAASVDAADSSVAKVKTTLARQSIWLAQTPQMFRVGELTAALSGALQAGVEVTDEASAMEWAGHRPLLVPGSPSNLKVTWPEDFEWVGEMP